MNEIKAKSNEPKDYKERFEFRLTVDNNIICQRYFKIKNFNPMCLASEELTDTIRRCAHVIDRDLKQKTQIYLDIFCPQLFDSIEQMNQFLSNPYNVSRIHMATSLVVRGHDKDFYLDDKGQVKECPFKFNYEEMESPLKPEDHVNYKFAFLVDDKEVCSTIWEGLYPKFVRNSIDLSNKRGKFEGEDANFLTFEQYLLYKMVEGRGDLVYGIIKDICYTCCADNSYYTTVLEYGDKVYKNRVKTFNSEKQTSNK